MSLPDSAILVKQVTVFKGVAEVCKAAIGGSDRTIIITEILEAVVQTIG